MTKTSSTSPSVRQRDTTKEGVTEKTLTDIKGLSRLQPTLKPTIRIVGRRREAGRFKCGNNGEEQKPADEGSDWVCRQQQTENE
uniref:Uncharacterized protein n=1 Tax=Angiostrongylus cantonensis TaxID=6313 RepID=A0A0K0CTH6_ANGCA